MNKKRSKSFYELKHYLYKTKKDREKREAEINQLNNEIEEMKKVIRRIKEYGKKREN